MTSPRPALLLATALVLGPAAASAPPAWAEGAVLSPGAGTVFERDQNVELTASVERGSADTQMRLVDPAGGSRVVDSTSRSITADQQLRFALDTNCPQFSGADSCSGRRPARNGTWTVQLSGGASDSRTFVLRIPPRAPQGVRAEATGPRSVVVTWEPGPEPDLTGYAVVDASGARLADGDATCAAGTCRTVLTYDSDGPSTEAVAVRAERAVCPDCSGTLDATSPAVTVARPGAAAEVPADPQPGPGDTPPGDGGGTPAGPPSGGASPSAPAGEGGAGSPGGTGGGGTSGTPRGPGSPSGGGTSGAPDLIGPGTSTALPPDEFARTFQAFGPKIGLPKLPPLPASGVAAPSVAPLADGTFAPELPFDEEVVDERVPSFVAAPAERLGGAVSAAVDSERLMRSLAAALVLLLVCAHVRRWLAQSPTDLP